MNIKIPAHQWEECGHEENPRSRLLAGITINGCPMHLEAYEVTESDDRHGLQGFVEQFGDCENAFYEFTEGAAQTVEIAGRHYVLVATPYQA